MTLRFTWLALAVATLFIKLAFPQTSQTPNLELLHRQMLEAGEWRDRARIAAIVLRAYPNDSLAQHAIEEPALEAVRHQSPSPEMYEDGNLQGERFPDDFNRWCSERGIDTKAEFLLLLKDFPLRLYALQLLPKSKSWPILVEGLRSPISFVSAAAATVMAQTSPGRQSLREIGDALSANRQQSKYFEDGAIHALAMISEAASDQETQSLLKKLGLTEKFEKQYTAWQSSIRKPQQQ